MRERQQESEKKSNFAKRLREARELLRMTQDSLGKHWGKTGNYIYMLEKGIKPIGKKLEARVIELEAEVRQKLYSRNEPALVPLREEVSRDQDKTGAPVVSWVSAGLGGVYGDLAHQIEEAVETDLSDPNRYALIVEGESMLPKLEPGDRIVIAPNAQAINGDIVVARLRESGEVLLKLFHVAHGRVTLSSFHPAYPPREFRQNEFRFIQPVYALVRKLRAKRG